MELMQADLMRLFVVLYERCMTPTGTPQGEDPSSFDYVARQYKTIDLYRHVKVSQWWCIGF
jgi:hypothetical protein